MSAIRYLLLMLLQIVAGVALAQAPPRARPGSPPIDSVRVTFGPPEKTILVVGFVLDRGNRKPVPNVAVCYGRWQARSDANGHFVLYLPAQSFESGRLLTAKTLHYEGSAVIPKEVSKPVTLWLRRNAYRAQRYSKCKSPVKSVRRPPHNVEPIRGVPGNHTALFIWNTTDRQPLKLRTLTIRIGKDGFPREPIRVRIYRYNTLDEPPAEDLLRESFNICPLQAGTFTYDLSRYNVTAPSTGFFLAVEYTVGSDNLYCQDPFVSYSPIGPVLRPPCARANIRTWEYVILKGWHRATSTENCWPLYESAISVEVEPAPALPAKH